MAPTRKAIAYVAVACCLAPLAAHADDPVPTGTRPAYANDRDLTKTVPNQQAITALSWAPGLDDGYDPQGLTVIGNSVLVSAYKEKQPYRMGWLRRSPPER